MRNKLLLSGHWHGRKSIDSWTEVLLLCSLVIPEDGLKHRSLHVASRVAGGCSMSLKYGDLVLNLELGRVLVRFHGWRFFMSALVRRFLLLFHWGVVFAIDYRRRDGSHSSTCARKNCNVRLLVNATSDRLIGNVFSRDILRCNRVSHTLLWGLVN